MNNQVTLRLYGELTAYLASTPAQGNALTLDVDPFDSVENLLARLMIPAPMIYSVLVNGVHLSQMQRNRAGLLRKGDQVAVWPPTNS